VLEPGLLALADDCGGDEQPRRRAHVERCAAAAGAALEELGDRGWRELCAGLPAGAVRMSGRTARTVLPAHETPWAYDAGRRLALVPRESRSALASPRPAAPPDPARVAAVLAAAGA
jgi:hypothetical protein